MRGIIGRVEYLRALLARYGPFETLGFVIEEELGLADHEDLNKEEKEESDEL
jgi:hypothetical protein